jgi:ABC-2 type transport system ATP-binding protein
MLAMDSGKGVIVIENLVKRYGKTAAVDGISFSIRKGEIFGLLGPNGAGKTTTLLMLSTLLAPTGGKAAVNGRDIGTEPARVRDSIGMVFQDPSSDELLTAYENLKLHALMYDLPMAEIDGRIARVMRLVGLEGRVHDQVKKYSGGMRRRMEIARGLLHQPSVLFLDEPTLGLDPQTREHIWEYIDTLAKKLGMTIIITTHYMEEAEKLCDRIAIIDRGRIIALDTPERLKRSIGLDMVTLRSGGLHIGRLRALPFVKGIERKNGTVRLFLEDSAANLAKVLEAAGRIDHIEVRPPDMNDVFLHYTGRKMREDSADTLDRLRVYDRAGKS